MITAAIRPAFLTRAGRFFRQDFSSVRVIFSTEPLAVSALAFAGGEEIHLIPEMAAQAPEQLSQIMIHELAHIVQQRAGRVSGAAGSVVIDPRLEAEADACAELFAVGFGVAPFAITSDCRRVFRPRRSGTIQPISRDKYMFIPAAANLAPTDQAAKIKYDEFLGKVKTAFGANKTERTQAAAASHGTMVMNLKSGGTEVHGDNAGVLLTYERAHLQGGGDWSTFKTTLSGLKLDPGTGAAANEILQIQGAPDANGRGTATIKCKLRHTIPPQFASNPRPVDKRLNEYTLGTVLFGDARFTPAKVQPAGACNQVYVRGKVVGEAIVADGVSGRHYIKLSNSESYVKRYVVRGINHQDAAALDGAQNLTAPVSGDTANKSETSLKKSGRHGTQPGKQLTEKQQMISHARGWQKRYISTGVSKRDAYSTRGEKFDGIYGAVLVDLAMVPEKTIFDLHTPAAAYKLLSLDAMTVESSADPGLGKKTIEGEEFLALRDVLRTRELLIKKSVPIEAVRKHDLGKCIVGIGVLQRVDEAAMADRLSKLSEVPGYLRKDVIVYKGLHNRYWFFMRFANGVDASKTLTALRTAAVDGEEYIQLSAYGMPMEKQEGQ